MYWWCWPFAETFATLSRIKGATSMVERPWLRFTALCFTASGVNSVHTVSPNPLERVLTFEAREPVLRAGTARAAATAGVVAVALDGSWPPSRARRLPDEEARRNEAIFTETKRTAA